MSLLITLLICLALLIAQHKHYGFLEDQKINYDLDIFKKEFNEKLQMFHLELDKMDEIKKRVDALAIKNGFKL